MSRSRGEALTDPAIREPLIFLSEFKFCLRDIPEEITLRLYRPVHSGLIVVRRSHEIYVEGLDPAAEVACEEEASDGEGEALHRAIGEMVCVYNAAWAKGLTPDVSWLKAKAGFR